uniref:Uncharacterized protein n=1 Tax=Eutreptiella gymnastica TaxID=73025 RepID=A0A7S4LKE7_9EUGL
MGSIFFRLFLCAPMASHCSLMGSAADPAWRPEYKQPAEIKIKIGDKAGDGPLHVRTKAQLPPKELEVGDNGDGTMSVKFTPICVGKHTFELTWGEEAIPGAPLEVTVVGEVERDPSFVKVSGDGLNGGVVGTPVVLTVEAQDDAGPGPLQVEADGPTPPTIQLGKLGSGKYSVTLMMKRKGQYKVEINWGSWEYPVPGSPFKIDVTE